MIYKWNELEYSDFKNFMKDYWFSKKWTSGTIIEVQGVTPIIMGSNIRIYLGNNINPQLLAPIDYETLTKKMGEVMSEQTVEYILNSNETFYLITLKDAVPSKLPEVSVLPIKLPLPPGSNITTDDLKGMFEEIWKFYIAGEKSISDIYFPNWYTKDDDKLVAYIGNERDISSVEDSKKFFRCRAIDTKDWVKMITEDYIKRNNLLWTDKDLSEDNIVINKFPISNFDDFIQYMRNVLDVKDLN